MSRLQLSWGKLTLQYIYKNIYRHINAYTQHLSSARRHSNELWPCSINHSPTKLHQSFPLRQKLKENKQFLYDCTGGTQKSPKSLNREISWVSVGQEVPGVSSEHLRAPMNFHDPNEPHLCSAPTPMGWEPIEAQPGVWVGFLGCVTGLGCVLFVLVLHGPAASLCLLCPGKC